MGLDGLDAEFSLPPPPAAGVRRADEAEKGLRVSGREAAAAAVALPPPRSLRREDMGAAMQG
uniref:Uncharacterized protein n=1 Tax=Arundo donax TaxID=35708 RepID=A0A0A8XSU8_ARUDO